VGAGAGAAHAGDVLEKNRRRQALLSATRAAPLRSARAVLVPRAGLGLAGWPAAPSAEQQHAHLVGAATMRRDLTGVRGLDSSADACAPCSACHPHRDVSASVLENLERVLQLKFPSPTDTKREEFRLECGICYAHRLSRPGDAEACLPECCCENTHCGRAFHQPCLFEWLQSLPDSRRSFDTIFGSCPYCSEMLKVSSFS